MNRKFGFVLSLCVAFLCLLSSCTAQEVPTQVEAEQAKETEQMVGEGNSLFDNVAVSNGGFSLSVYDGETGYTRSMYNDYSEEQILEQLSAVPACNTEEWSVENITFPFMDLRRELPTGAGFAWSGATAI